MMKKDAVISSCGKYRYALWRIWDETEPLVMFIGLNPSTADAVKDDNTIRKCEVFAKKWGFGGLSIGNLFALRSSKPTDLWKSDDPIGPENDKWLGALEAKAKIIVAAWGNHGAHLRRGQVVLKMFPDLYCLKVSAKGMPCHPLYLTRDLKPFRLAEKVTENT